MSGDKGGFGVVGAIEKTVAVEPGIAFRNFRELRQEVSAIQRGVGKIVFHAFQIQKEKIALLCRKVSGGYDGRFVIFFVKGAGRGLLIFIWAYADLADAAGSAADERSGTVVAGNGNLPHRNYRSLNRTVNFADGAGVILVGADSRRTGPRCQQHGQNYQ